MFLKNCRVFDFPSFLDFDDTSIRKLNFNLEENSDSYILTFATPGLTTRDFEIKILKNILHVKTKEKFNSNFFFSNHMEEAFNLPDTIDLKEVTASCTNGLLKVELPKKENLEDEVIRVL